MMRAASGRALYLIGFLLCAGSLHAAQQNCGGVGHANTVLAVRTGPPQLRSPYAKALARVWAGIRLQGPEFTAAYERLQADLLELLSTGAADFEHTLEALHQVLVNANVSDQQRAIALVAADFFRKDGKVIPGVILAFPTSGSSSWLKSAALGNRGYVIETVVARNAVEHGITMLGDATGTTLQVTKDNIAGFGKRVTTSLGATVEGDLVETIGGGERFFDFKAISAGFDVDQLRRARDAVLERRAQEFVFVAEQGAVIPSDWLMVLAEANNELVAQGRLPIRYGTVSGF